MIDIQHVCISCNFSVQEHERSNTTLKYIFIAKKHNQIISIHLFKTFKYARKIEVRNIFICPQVLEENELIRFTNIWIFNVNIWTIQDLFTTTIFTILNTSTMSEKKSSSAYPRYLLLISTSQIGEVFATSTIHWIFEALERPEKNIIWFKNIYVLAGVGHLRVVAIEHYISRVISLRRENGLNSVK